ncbi:MAG: hypothetical protein AAF512_12245 [Pseudomonadota bacterium]
MANNRMPNVILHISGYDDLGLDEELDMAIWVNNLHDYYYHDEGEPSALDVLKSIHKTLKPGGILGVMDHNGDKDKNNAKLHRIDPDIVRNLVKDAGFIIEAESGLFGNPEDDHSLMVYSDEVYLNTDRIFIKAKKPKKIGPKEV